MKAEMIKLRGFSDDVRFPGSVALIYIRLSLFFFFFFFKSLVLLPPILSLRESATVALFCAKGDTEVDPWSPGQTRLSVSLP